jgi:undecaprenyl-diphosphatase
VIFATAFALVFAVLWGIFLVAEPAMARLVKRSAHWTARFRYRDYLPVLIVLAIGIGAAAMAGDAFIDLAERVHANSAKLHHIDQETHEWARYTRTPGATRFFTTMTIIGTPGFLGGVVALVTIVLAVKKHWRWAIFLAVTTGVGSLLNVELKRFFARARPDLAEALRRASGYSFPSGHAMGSVIVLGAFAYLALRALPRWRWRAAVLALAVTLILAIASSRIYLGVHWISDVGAGLAAGLIWVTTSIVAYETFRRIRRIRELRAKRTPE